MYIATAYQGAACPPWPPLRSCILLLAAAQLSYGTDATPDMVDEDPDDGEDNTEDEKGDEEESFLDDQMVEC